MLPALFWLIAAFLVPAAGLLPAQGMGGAAKARPRPPSKAAPRPAPLSFSVRDVAKDAGLVAVDVHGGVSSKKHILEMTGHGVAIVDFDRDRLPDLLFVNGTRAGAAAPAAHALYRNLGGGRFRDVTAGSGLVNTGWGQGVCAGDLDNDGFTDLAIAYYGFNRLYRNRDGAAFEDVTARFGMPTAGDRWSTSCTFFDYDRDGRLDLYFSNYVAFDLAKASAPGSSPFCFWRGLAVFCGPKGFPSRAGILYRNEGGRMADVSQRAGVEAKGLHYGLGVVSSDFDGDGWPDLYVACDSTPSLLFRNNRNGTFADVAIEAGAAFGDAGQEQGSMGVAAADYDNDGHGDLLRTNFMDETATLYRNRGEWFFEDTTVAAGLGLQTKAVGWGVEFFDLDQDGWKDIFMANGHIYPELEAPAASGVREPFRQRKAVYWNLRNGTFVDIAGAGDALGPRFSSRGAAAGDIDGDGAVEIVVANMNDAPSLLQFSLARGNALIVELEGGAKSNRSAIGAKVTVRAGGLQQMREVQSGSSFASQSDLRLHFGLGAAATVDEIAVRWPSGAREVISGAGVNRWLLIREGAGVADQRAFSAAPASKR